ncbi:MAG: tetratricopeptide repeat protein [Rhodospirillaceae bacterium]|nr:tetratricopeptide repeat protein [Rhodospirillaceae bacterium]
MNDLPSILALYESGHLAEAEEACAALTAQAPESGAAWALRGQIALNRALFPEAVDYLERAVALTPDELDHLRNLGMALYGAGRYRDSLMTLKRVLKRDTSNAVAFLYAGRCHLALERFDEAAAALNAALVLRPEWPDALEGFAVFSLAVNRPDKALAFALRVLRAEPGRIASLELAGHASEVLGDYETAGAYYHEAAALRPEAPIVSKLAFAMQRMGRHEDAVAAFRHALKREPESAPLQHAQGSSLLALGRLEAGWPLYAKRLTGGASHESARTGDASLQAPPSPGMRVVAWADQGIGEQLLFASLIPDLIATGADLAVECDYRLVPLLTRSFPGVTVCPHTAPPHPALAAFTDGRLCLSDAAAWFRKDFSDFPAHPGYLKPDVRRRADLRAKYRDGRLSPRPLIGISWQRADGTLLSPAKSLPLAQWGPILHVAGCTFVNLQYGNTAAEIDAVSRTAGVRIVSDPAVDPLIDLDAFAAQVAAMDLVISTSSATAHMAGALGVPVWTLLPVGVGALWHWFLDREDSPWYPSMRLIRQSTRGAWDPVLDAASAGLVEFVEAWRDRG